MNPYFSYLINSIIVMIKLLIFKNFRKQTNLIYTFLDVNIL